jgi:glyoxylase-like metal-dependent hydrolase (beta-lactamase superfamily II)
MSYFRISIIFALLITIAISGCTDIDTEIPICKYENGSVSNQLPCEITNDVYLLGVAGFDEEYTGTDHVEIDMSSNRYGIVDSDKIILIEAGGRLSFYPLVSNLDKLGFSLEDVEAVVLTHFHYDHAYNSYRFQDLGIPIYAHEKTAECIESDSVCPETIYDFPPVNVTRKLKDGEIINFKEKKIKVIHTPGHTKDSTCFLLNHQGKNILFSGDTCFFNGSIAGCNSLETPDCTANEMHVESLEKLASFEIDLMLCGHAHQNELVIKNGEEHVKKCLENAKS